MSCNFCNTDLYIKTVQYAAPLLMPLTREDALRQQLESLTGEVYLKVQNKYCPMCGAKIEGEQNDN